MALAPALLVGCGGVVGGESTSPVTPVAERPPAAHLRVPRLDGTGTLAIGAPSARPTVVNMWASWCGPCRKEMPDLQRFAQSHPDVRVVGVAVNDNADDARAFARQVGVRFPLGFDADHQVADTYGVSGLPTTVVLDRKGRVAVTWPGPINVQQLAAATGSLTSGD